MTFQFMVTLLLGVWQFITDCHIGALGTRRAVSSYCYIRGKNIDFWFENSTLQDPEAEIEIFDFTSDEVEALVSFAKAVAPVL